MLHKLSKTIASTSVGLILLFTKQACAQERDAEWRNQFKARTTPLGSTLAEPPAPKQASGKVSYTFHFPKDPSPEEELILKDIAASVEKAVKIYNANTTLKKELNIYYEPGVPTADGNINGSIRFGKSAHNLRVALHEMGHTMGVGQHQNWPKLMVGGLWQGKNANKILQDLTHDPKAILHGDHMHFWPYGLNYDNEVKSDEDFASHARIVNAIVKDLDSAK